MSYNFIPVSVEEITSEPLKLLFTYVTSKQRDIPNPLAIDISANKVKIHRSLEGMFDLKQLKKEFGVSVTYGNGSRGNTGSCNRGFIFEKDLSNDLNYYAQTKDLCYNYKYKSWLTDFVSGHDDKHIEVINEGALNKPRPMKFVDGKPLISGGFDNIGHLVTDITVKFNGQPKYLSLKLGSSVSIFNIGIAKYIRWDEINRGKIINEYGLTLLNGLGLDPDKFANGFREYSKSNPIVQRPGEYVTADTSMLHDLLVSGIGYGYTLVQAKSPKSTDIKSIDLNDLEIVRNMTKPKSTKVYYAGPSSKYVNMKVESEKFDFNIQMRNVSGGITPSVLLCYYKAKENVVT